MCLSTFSRLRRSLATSTLSAAVRILAERFLLYRKAISCKAKKDCKPYGLQPHHIYLQNRIQETLHLLTYLRLGYALDRLVSVSYMCYHTSTSDLSTSSSSRGLTNLRMGYLILRGASRLDAFSVYPFPAWLLCHALGRTTDTPAASPSRSSRTKDSSSQISYAHAG